MRITRYGTLGVLLIFSAQAALAAGTQTAGLAPALGARFKATLLVDPALTMPDKAPKATSADTLTKALDALIAQVPGSAWRQLYLQLPKGAGLPSAAVLATKVRSLERDARMNIIVGNGTDDRATMQLSGQPLTKGYREQLTRAGYRMVYLIFSKTPPLSVPSASNPSSAEARRPVSDEFGDMLGSFFTLDPLEQQSSMREAMSLLGTLPPAARAEFVTQIWRSMDSNLQQAVIRDVTRSMGGPARL